MEHVKVLLFRNLKMCRPEDKSISHQKYKYYCSIPKEQITKEIINFEIFFKFVQASYYYYYYYSLFCNVCIYLLLIRSTSILTKCSVNIRQIYSINLVNLSSNENIADFHPPQTWHPNPYGGGEGNVILHGP